MNPFVAFMQKPAGRIIRIAAGLALIAGGPALLGGPVGYVVGAIGLVPLAAGLLDFCAMAPLFRVPWSGEAIRALNDPDHPRRRPFTGSHA